MVLRLLKFQVFLQALIMPTFSSYNANISKPESNASEFEGKLNGNENQKENKAETVVVKGQEKKDSQPVNTHGMAEELFLIKIDNLGFVC